jgi:hypothetical protein
VATAVQSFRDKCGPERDRLVLPCIAGIGLLWDIGTMKITIGVI